MVPDAMLFQRHFSKAGFSDQPVPILNPFLLFLRSEGSDNASGLDTAMSNMNKPELFPGMVSCG
jgi:hypothetical protein